MANNQSRRVVSRRVASKTAIIAALTLLLALVGARTLAFTPVVHAGSTPTIVQSVTADNMTGGNGAISLSFPSAITSGDEIVALIGWGGGNDFSVNPVHDFQGNSWTSINGVGSGDGLLDNADIYAAQVTSGGSDSVTLSFSENGCPCSSTWIQSTMTLVELSGQDTSHLKSGTASLVENGTGGTSHVTNNNLLGTANSDLDLAIYVDGGANTAISVASGESQVGSNNSATVNIQHDQLSADAASSLEFDTAASAGYCVIVGASFAS